MDVCIHFYGHVCGHVYGHVYDHVHRMFGTKFAKVTELYVRWEYAGGCACECTLVCTFTCAFCLVVAAKQTKKIAALNVLLKRQKPAGSVLECDVSERRAVSDISELVDGARVWHYRRGEGTLVWRFEVGREDKQHLQHGLTIQIKTVNIDQMGKHRSTEDVWRAGRQAGRWMDRWSGRRKTGRQEQIVAWNRLIHTYTMDRYSVSYDNGELHS